YHQKYSYIPSSLNSNLSIDYEKQLKDLRKDSIFNEIGRRQEEQKVEINAKSRLKTHLIMSPIKNKWMSILTKSYVHGFGSEDDYLMRISLEYLRNELSNKNIYEFDNKDDIRALIINQLEYIWKESMKYEKVEIPKKEILKPETEE